MIITSWLVYLLMCLSVDWTTRVCIWWCAWKAQYVLTTNAWTFKERIHFYYRADFRLLWSRLVFMSVFRAGKQVRGSETAIWKSLLDKSFAFFRVWKDCVISTLRICKSFSFSLFVNSHCFQCIPTVFSFLCPIIGIHCGSDHNEFKRDLCGHHIWFPRNSIVMQHYYNIKITHYQLAAFHGETSPAA